MIENKKVNIIAKDHFLRNCKNNTVHSLIKEYNNDADLGKHIRNLYFDSLDYAREFEEMHK